MIQTIRDAESKIWTLQKEVTYFKTKINELERQVEELRVKISQSTPVNQSNGVDSYLNSDGSSVSHRLFHIFEKIKAKSLELAELTVETLTSKFINNSEHINTKTLTATGDIFADDITANGSLVSINNITAGNNINASGTITGQNLATNAGIIAGGEPGLNIFPNYVVRGVGATSTVLNYKDHAGNNASLTVITSVSPVVRTESIKAGLIVYSVG